MIEKIVLDYLTDKLDTTVDMERREQTIPFVIIEKTAGGRENLLNNATIAIQSYGNTLLEAAELNDKVKTAMYDITNELDKVTYASLNSDYNYTDTTTKNYRYQAIFDIYYIE